MPRPYKFRRVCSAPRCRSFHAAGTEKENKALELTVEEFEVVRLIDYEGMTQEEAAAQMLVARTTVQRIYNSARGKLAAFLIEGGSLQISGGNYEICGNENCRGQRHCCQCPCSHKQGECTPQNCKYIKQNHNKI